MSLDSILEKILAEGREEASRIEAESRSRARDVMTRAEAAVAEEEASLLKEAEWEARLEARRIVTQARLAGRLGLLQAKQDLVSEVLEKAFGEELTARAVPKKKVVFRDGVKEEPFEKKRLMDDLRPKLENFIAEVLDL